MSDKRCEKLDKAMSVDCVIESKRMADVILRKVHRGPGDTVGAAIHRAERQYGAPATWLHRLRYRELNDLPASVFLSILKAYHAACEAGERAYDMERKGPDEINPYLAGLADRLAGKAPQTETLKQPEK